MFSFSKFIKMSGPGLGPGLCAQNSNPCRPKLLGKKTSLKKSRGLTLERICGCARCLIGSVLTWSVFYFLRSTVHCTFHPGHLSKVVTQIGKVGMESIVEQILPTVGCGVRTDYEIPIEKVEEKKTTEIEGNEDIPEAAEQSPSARESLNNCLVIH